MPVCPLRVTGLAVLDDEETTYDRARLNQFMNAALKSVTASKDAQDDRWKALSWSLDGMRSPEVDVLALAQRSFKIRPIVIVGAGPAAQECARQISTRLRSNQQENNHWILMFNGEKFLPYHRAQLSTALDSRGRADTLLAHGFADNVVIAHGVNISVIEPQDKRLFTDNGIEFSYHKLILATGSQSKRPVVPGLHGSRVFDFRQLDDVEKIAALAPKRIAVLGGGLLGIEAARALRAFCDDVTVFARSSHLLSRQVDNGAGECVARHLRASGVKVHVATRLIAAEVGYGQITLHDELNTTLSYDAVICATGISPSIGLAEHAHLQYHLGIEVNEAQQTSDPDVYAIGECAERDGKVAGNLSISLEQARCAAAAILNESLPSSRHVDVFQLKMGSCVVVAIGDVGDNNEKSLTFAPDQRSYRRVFVKDHRVVGAILVGESGLDISAFTDAVERQLAWSDTVARRFYKTGELPHGANIASDTVICFCTGTTYGKLTELRDASHSHDNITSQTGASLHCGSCAQRVAIITNNTRSSSTPASQPKALWSATSLAMLATVAAVSAYAIPFATTWQSPWRMVDVLWRGYVAKQVSGFLLLALMIAAFVPALSRRLQRNDRRPQKLSLMSWHLIAACSVIVGFVVHTGARMGYGLNAILGASFVATLLLGGLASLGWKYASRSQPLRAVSANIRSLHWAVLFPLPAIVAFHILKVYYF